MGIADYVLRGAVAALLGVALFNVVLNVQVVYEAAPRQAAVLHLPLSRDLAARDGGAVSDGETSRAGAVHGAGEPRGTADVLPLRRARLRAEAVPRSEIRSTIHEGGAALVASKMPGGGERSWPSGRDECDVFLETVEQEWPDPMLLEMIHAQQEECGAYTADDWRALRLKAAEAVRARRAVAYFAHISKTGGTVITETVRKGGVAVPKMGRSNAQIDNMGPKKYPLGDGTPAWYGRAVAADGRPTWPYLPVELQRAAVREWRTKHNGQYGSREFGLTRTPMLCPGEDIAYFGTIRHPFRRIQSLITNWVPKGWVNRDETLRPESQSDSGRHKLNDHTVAWYAGFSQHGRVYAPMNGTTLRMAQWRWCALFSGSIAMDDHPEVDWKDLMHDAWGLSSHFVNCTGVEHKSKSSGRVHCPGTDKKAERWLASLPEEERLLVTEHNEFDISFWEFQLRTRHLRNREAIPSPP